MSAPREAVWALMRRGVESTTHVLDWKPIWTISLSQWKLGKPPKPDRMDEAKALRRAVWDPVITPGDPIRNLQFLYGTRALILK